LIGFFLDSALTIPAGASAPKKFLVPLKGGMKTTTVYLGDPYNTFLSVAAAAGSTTLTVDDTSEFFASGQALVGTQTVTYTGILATELIGVTGLAAAATSGTTVVPLKNWIGEAQDVLYSGGTDKGTIGITMRLSGVGDFNYPGMPLILSSNPIQTGGLPLAIDVQITTPLADADQTYSNWTITSTLFYPRAVGDTTPIGSDDVGTTSLLPGYIIQHDQALPQSVRLLPLNRAINAPTGFIWGQYRWRDQNEINEQTILPSNWSIDPNSLGAEKFVAGIGMTDDLEPVGIVQEDDSIFLQVTRGFYYTGINSYYLPATPQLDFLPSFVSTLFLTKSPQQTIPIFVGTYQLDSQGYYEKSTEYRYQTAAAVTRATNLPALYYTLDRSNNTITLNQPMATQDIFLGTISGKSIDYFNIPTYPVETVRQVYVLAAAGATPTTATNWEYDGAAGTITITAPSGSGVSVPGTLQGMSVFATCTPALAVLYETGTTDTLTINEVDLNPAFAGLAGGYVYLEQSRQEAASIVLSCDKPLIPIPATLASIIGLIAYGPVYFNGDYALLQAQAFSGVAGETVSNVKMKVIVSPDTFSGFINYIDPTVTPIEVITGADGIANLIFTPEENFGMTIPAAAPSGSLAGVTTTTIVNDTVILTEPIAISQIWNATDGWLVTLYLTLDNNPLFGKVGADVGAGEILYVTSGTPGEVGFKTNGYLQPWLSSTNLYLPIKALDSNGNDHTSSQFSGNVVSLVYANSIPIASPVSALFLTFLQRSIVQLQEVNSDVTSNSVMLQMEMAPTIDDNVWLILNDATNGILNQYRLGVTTS
jgi:hypothetical protein